MLNDAFEFGFGLPSLEEIEEMDRQRSHAIESLQTSESEGGSFVKCQRCNNDIPIIGTSSSSRPRPCCNGRAAMLQSRIKWMENYYHGVNDNDLNALRQELTAPLEEDANADKLRCLPLYSCRITGWKFVCSKFYYKIYQGS